jgi:hypothetical protein
VSENTAATTSATQDQRPIVARSYDSPLLAASEPEHVLQLEDEVQKQRADDNRAALPGTRPSKRNYVVRSGQAKWEIGLYALQHSVSAACNKWDLPQSTVSNYKKLASYSLSGSRLLMQPQPDESAFDYAARVHEESKGYVEHMHDAAWSNERRVQRALLWDVQTETTAVASILALRASGAAVDLRLVRTLLLDSIRVHEPHIIEEKKLVLSRPTLYVGCVL